MACNRPGDALQMLQLGNTSSHNYSGYSTVTPYSYTTDPDILHHRDWYTNVEHILDRYITHAICLFGIIGNFVNIMVLTSRTVSRHLGNLERSVHLGLIALAVSDMLYCACSFPQAWQDSTSFGSPTIDFWLVYNTYGAACINCFLLCSSWLTVAMAVSRYLVICYPLKGRIWLGLPASRTIIVSVFVTSILFNLPRFWMTKIAWIECDDGGRSYFSMPGYIDPQHEGYATYRWLYFILGIMVPLLLLCYCNIFLVRALQVSSQLRKNQMYMSTSLSSTGTLTSTSLTTPVSSSPQYHAPHNSEATRVVTLTLCIIVILYIVLVGPAELVTFWSHFVRDHLLRYRLAVKLCNALQMLNFAVNFILYCIINVHFRKVIKDLVFCLHLREYMQPPPSHTAQDNTTHETSVML